MIHSFQVMLENEFYKHQWNIGSPPIINILVNLNLFNLPIYMSKISPEEQQIIFNDLIETEHQLLSELLKCAVLHSRISSQIYDIINEGIKRLIEDLVNPNQVVVVPNYLLQVKIYLNEMELEHFSNMHVNTILLQDECTGREAFQRQFDWSRESSVFQNESLHDIVRTICSNGEEILNQLLKLISGSSFANWKFGLGFINCILDLHPDCKPIVKSNVLPFYFQPLYKK